MVRVADTITLAGGAVAGSSLVAAAMGHPFLAAKLILASYIADVLDGWAARHVDAKRGLGPTREGQMLDRSLDRITQIVAPLVALASYYHGLGVGLPVQLLLAAYAAIIVPASVYRLVYRVRAALDYFPGTPLFVHAMIMLGTILMEARGEYRIPLLLLVASIGTASSIPYVRRLPGRRSTQPSPALLPRLALLLLLVLAPKGAPSRILGEALLFLSTLYLGLGWIPPLIERRGFQPGKPASVN